MLAEPATRLPGSPEYFYEVKWEGVRALISLDEGELRIHDKAGADITAQFPELLIPDKALRATSALFDAAIVCLDADGKPVLENVEKRLQQKTDKAISDKETKHPAHCYVFDCLYLDGRAIINEPLVRRREWLQDAIRKDTPYRVSEVFEDGPLFFQAAKEMGVATIIAKIRSSAYLPAKRTDAWLNITPRKRRRTRASRSGSSCPTPPAGRWTRSRACWARK